MFQSILAAIFIIVLTITYKFFPDTFWEYFPWKFETTQNSQNFSEPEATKAPLPPALSQSQPHSEIKKPAPSTINRNNSATIEVIPTWGVAQNRVGFYQNNPQENQRQAIAGYIPQGSDVRILSASGGYYEVHHNGFIVWISRGDLNIESN